MPFNKTLCLFGVTLGLLALSDGKVVILHDNDIGGIDSSDEDPNTHQVGKEAEGDAAKRMRSAMHTVVLGRRPLRGPRARLRGPSVRRVRFKDAPNLPRKDNLSRKGNLPVAEAVWQKRISQRAKDEKASVMTLASRLMKTQSKRREAEDDLNRQRGIFWKQGAQVDSQDKQAQQQRDLLLKSFISQQETIELDKQHERQLENQLDRQQEQLTESQQTDAAEDFAHHPSDDITLMARDEGLMTQPELNHPYLQAINKHQTEQFRVLGEMLSKYPQLTVIIAGSGVSPSGQIRHNLGRGDGALAPAEWTDMGLEKEYHENQKHLATLVNDLARRFGNQISFSFFKPTDIQRWNWVVWAANIDIWNLPVGMEVSSNGQGAYIETSRPGAYGIVTTPRGCTNSNLNELYAQRRWLAGPYLDAHTIFSYGSPPKTQLAPLTSTPSKLVAADAGGAARTKSSLSPSESGSDKSTLITLACVGALLFLIILYAFSRYIIGRLRTKGRAKKAASDKRHPSCDRSYIDHWDWEKLDKIGQGAFGSVYSAVNNRTGGLFAIKELWLGRSDTPKALSERRIAKFQGEIDTLSKLEHKHIVKHLGSAKCENYFYLYLEYVGGGNLQELLTTLAQPMELTLSRNYTMQLLKGLQYLHDNGVIHRDLKPANVLLTIEGTLKLADFGTAFHMDSMTHTTQQTVCGTPLFMAPEVITQEKHTTSSDIWSLGVIIFNVITARYPFNKGTTLSLLMSLALGRAEIAWPDDIPPRVKRFVGSCLQRNPARRPSARELITRLEAIEKAVANEEKAIVEDATDLYLEIKQ